jgi:hypothetical protein
MGQQGSEWNYVLLQYRLMRNSSESRLPTFILPFAALSLTAVLLGCATAWLHGISAAVVALNMAAWLAGFAAAPQLSRAKPPAAPWLAALATITLAVTLLSPGMSGVHRWIALGPVRLNMAELLLPLVVVVLASLAPRSPLRLLLPIAVSLILFAQPDASQAVAFAGGAVLLIIASTRSRIQRSIAGLALVATAVATCFRPDPLGPVPQVEGIIGLAAQTSPLLAAAAVLALAGIVLLVAHRARAAKPSPQRVAATSLALYFALSALAPLFGAYPVPLIGMGVSPMLGLWLGMGWLLRP